MTWPQAVLALGGAPGDLPHCMEMTVKTYCVVYAGRGGVCAVVDCRIAFVEEGLNGNEEDSGEWSDERWAASEWTEWIERATVRSDEEPTQTLSIDGEVVDNEGNEWEDCDLSSEWVETVWCGLVWAGVGRKWPLPLSSEEGSSCNPPQIGIQCYQSSLLLLHLAHVETILAGLLYSVQPAAQSLPRSPSVVSTATVQGLRTTTAGMAFQSCTRGSAQLIRNSTCLTTPPSLRVNQHCLTRLIRCNQLLPADVWLPRSFSRTV